MNPLATGHLAVVLALVAAFASAATFGLSTSLQHRVVEATESSTEFGARFLARLARRPSWVIGICLSVAAFGLHAVAISLGALPMVQPVIVSGIVFAVLIRAGLDRRLPSRWELTWALVTWAGLALFIAVVRPGPPLVVPDDVVAFIFSVAALLVAAAAIRLANTCRTPERRGLWFGMAAGVLFGLVAGLLKIVIALAAKDPLMVVLHWPTWVMVASGLWAMSLNQRAYQVTRLSVSMPILNIVDVVVALAFAAAVFGEHLASNPGTLAAEALALGVMALGVRQLARREEQLEAAAAEESSVPAAAPR